jgi:GMP synthase - Glutamine amidotransferase domain
MTKDTPHVAILVLDAPIPELSKTYGDFGDVSSELLTQGGTCKYPTTKYQLFYKDDNHKQELLNTYEILKRDINAGTIKGVFLTGSVADAFETGVLWIDLLNEFISQFLSKLENFPIVGICFGHQILAKGLGSKVARNLPEIGLEYGTSTIKLNDDITNSFEKGKVTLKNTYNKMIVMSQRAGISWKMWLVVFAIVFLWFFWIWIT